MKIRISDYIGEQYKVWTPGSTVIIDAYTGSGKTYFVRKKLLPNAIRNGKKIVYFCNRKSLKDQVKDLQEKEEIEVDGAIYNSSEHFYIVSYQYCETVNKFPDFTIDLNKLEKEEKTPYKNKKQNISINHKDIMYYIFDEAHYFVMDSSFNRKNAFWFEQKFRFKDSISLFLTATPEPFYLFYYFNQKRTELTECLHKFIRAAEHRNRYQEKIDSLIDNFYVLDREKIIDAYKSQIAKITKDKLYENLISEIDDILKMFKPQETSSSQFLLKGENPVEVYSYLLEKDYNQYKCYYFEEYDSIINKIILSDEKWLIFVNSEDDGKKLETELNIKNSILNPTITFPFVPYAVFLSSETKNTTASTTYKEIVSKEKFECTVLIATSVIDCGVNIKDETLNNIVIAQPDKTEFFQMLGRLRETETQKIYLYIKSISDETKKCLVNTSKKEIGLAINYETFKLYNTFNNSDYSEMSKEAQKQKLIDNLINNEWSHIFTLSKDRKQLYERNGAIINIMEDVKINNSYLIYNFYKIWQYCKPSEEYVNNNTTKDSHLFKQLGWISKKYLPASWVNHEEYRQEIVDTLESFKNMGYLDSTAYKNLKEELFSRILKLPVMLLPEQIVKDISDYKKGRMPHFSTINNILSFLGFNYIIKDKRSNGKKKWYIDHLERIDE